MKSNFNLRIFLGKLFGWYMPATQDVFTPSRPAIICYVKRTELEQQIMNAVHRPGRQILLYGALGSGISSVLEHLFPGSGRKAIRIECGAGLSYNQLLNKILAELHLRAVAGSLEEESRNILFLVAARRRMLIIENIELLDAGARAKVLQLAGLGMELKVKVILTASVKRIKYLGCKNVFKGFGFSNIHVPPLGRGHLRQIILLGEAALRIKFSQAIRHDIMRISRSASSCHFNALNECLKYGVLKKQRKKMVITRAGDQPLHPKISRAVRQRI